MTPAGSEAERANILLVDDRRESLLALEAILERPDYELVPVTSGSEALGQVLRREFAVILLDIGMPRMDGLEVAGIIKQREQSRYIPIIFITGSAYDVENIFRGYSAGAVDFLYKPVDPYALRAKVAVFVALYRQRRQIERQAAQIEITFEEAPVGIGHADAAGRLTRVNRRLCEIVGVAPPELMGRTIDEVFEGEERKAVAKHVAQLRAGVRLSAGEHLLRTVRGVPVWVSVTLSGLRDGSHGAVREAIVVVDDVSERRRFELERSRVLRDLGDGIRARDDFLAIAAHELKTPLTPLRLQTEGLLRELRDPGRPLSRESLAPRIEAVARVEARLEVLIERLLDMSRLSVGQLTLDLEEVDVVSVVDEVVARMRDDAERVGCVVSVEAEGPVVGHWDRMWMGQVVTHLLSNALKYGSGEPVEIRVEADGDLGRIAVRDRGVGIEQGQEERIFERFDRVASPRHFGGFGLGLWMVRQIVHAHHGSVRVKSRPGEGSEFIVELPRRLETSVTAEGQKEPSRLPGADGSPACRS